MIHQMIFAHPKPGMTEAEFQRYWVEVHAVKYASKIKQIKRYLIDTRIPFGDDGGDPLWSGVAEIWLENEEEQIASLQSKEFLEGARADEPNWAAFWRTVGLDTDTHILLEGPPLAQDSSLIKMIGLIKRKPGMNLNDFRAHCFEVHAPLVLRLPGLRRYYQCHARDAHYAVGESMFDAVVQLWFDDTAALEHALTSAEGKAAAADQPNFVDMRYAHTMVCKEHWVIGPAFR